ncbi:P-type DNA transfer protein VirB5 [Aquabacterium sp. CECT 9606]|uniref:P-type DNA transfer protein VirB5 n=1 Tax=Aquabacterium sp. CECT 9606 TaxID=2845822 RepID=UPI001E48FA85|nr:P-type DNA transfer protein VirB5 [Aquabacterium sp. CECT 9606]CAH0356074.1 Type IV secretion system protein virB5 [Aquabacterium sp. CECT 9606]
MKSIKRFFLSLTLVGSFFGSGSAHAGIPVIDAANLAQSIQQVIAWANQYQQMVQQYQQLNQQYNSLVGSRGLGDIMNNQLLQNVVPTDVTTLLNSVNSGGYNSLTGAAQTLRQGVMIYNCGDRTGEAKQTCEAALNANAQVQSLQQTAMGLITQRVQQIQSLQSQINTTQDPKAIAELQARIAAENTQVSNDANRLAVMQANAQSAKEAADQAIKERGLKMLASTAPAAANTFVYTAPN